MISIVCKIQIAETHQIDIFLKGAMVISVSFDGAWQKRGTGHAYNSLTGNFLIYFSIYEIYLLVAFRKNKYLSILSL